MKSTILNFSINNEFICYILIPEDTEVIQMKRFLNCWYEQQYIKNDICLIDYLENNYIKIEFDTSIEGLLSEKENKEYNLEFHNY